MTTDTARLGISPAHASSPPQVVWRRLAPMVAAPGRSRMRLWNPDTDKFSDTAKRTDTLPGRPAAMYLYNKRRTYLLALDFDAKHAGSAATDADLAAAAAWITQCGGVIVTDRSTSGGRHLLCPLAIGTSASLDEIVHLTRLLAARLPTLDITPNTNAVTGCITAPGSPCREGGYRQLDGALDAAIEAFTTRSAPDLLPRLYMLLGALRPTPSTPTPTTTGPASQQTRRRHTVGDGDDERLAPAYVRGDPLPPEVADYATHGTLSPIRPTWKSNHEARMAVVTAAIARGHSLDSIRAMTTPGRPWHNGLGRAYQRYHHRADDALTRDHTKALNWLINNVLKSPPPQHKTKYSPGGQGGPQGPRQLREWLANALAWADQEFAGKRYRWTVHAVLQTLAFHAVVAGEQRSGTWVVGVGGRALSLGTGLLSEDSVWRVLRDVRERGGAPLVLARQHVGLDADVYALTSQNRITTDPHRAERVRIEPVHDAWNVLGHHLRRIYELITHHGLTSKADIYAAAAIPRSTGDTMILDLEVAGLVTRTGWGTVSTGPNTLDAIANGHRLEQSRHERIERYRAERATWKAWLAAREEQLRPTQPVDEALAPNPRAAHPMSAPADGDHEAWLESVMATGPPDRDDDHQIEREAIELVAELLGARIAAA